MRQIVLNSIATTLVLVLVRRASFRSLKWCRHALDTLATQGRDKFLLPRYLYACRSINVVMVRPRPPITQPIRRPYKRQAKSQITVRKARKSILLVTLYSSNVVFFSSSTFTIPTVTLSAQIDDDAEPHIPLRSPLLSQLPVLPATPKFPFKKKEE